MKLFSACLLIIVCLPAGAMAEEVDWESLAQYAYGQDRAPLYAVNRLINQTHNDFEAREAIETRLIAMITSDEATTDAKAFACEALSRMGAYPAIFPLAALLTDPVLAAHALVALERIPQAEANRAMREQLDKIEGDLRIGVINSLGNRGAASSVEALSAQTELPDYAAAAITALAKINHEDALAALGSILTQNREDPIVGHAMLQFAHTAANEQNRDHALLLLDYLHRQGATDTLKTAGLIGLIEHRPETAVFLVYDALLTGAPHYVEATLVALNIPEISETMIAAFRRVLHELEPETQAVFAAALAARSDPEAARAVSPKMRDAVEEARGKHRAAPLVGAGATIGPEDPLLPDGYDIAAWLNCGAQPRTPEQAAPAIALVSGLSHTFPEVAGAVGTAAFDPERVVYEISGLNPDADYVLGFTWWDADDSGRTQSVRFSADGNTWETVVPPVRAAAYNNDVSTHARVLLPLAAPYNALETLRVAFVNEAGPNAVVNELWLLERTAPAKSKRVLIVTGDDYGGHLWRDTAPALAALLREDDRIEVSINECPAIYGSPLINHYDATVLHFKNYAERLPLGEPVQEGLKRYVAAGNGLVLTHFACGAFQEWDGFVHIAGRIWNPAMRAHDPHGTFTVRVIDDSHAITQGMDAFEITDELYTCLDGDAPITLLCDAVSVVDKETYPMAFLVEDTGGRVFHSPLGHDPVAYSASGARTLYQRATAWAAGLEPLP